MISSLIAKYENWLTGGRLAFLFIIATAIYLVMVLLTLPELSQKAGGLQMFDLLPTGYDSPYAMQLLQSLGEDGRWYYLAIQIPLDLLYPGLLSAVLSGAWLMLLQRGDITANSSKTFAIVAILAGLADYGENLAVATMLINFPNISQALITTASWFTVIKSGLTTIFFISLTILAGRVFFVKK
ncbi:MAG: hypothetical protein HQL69_08965 [Magnetococcales bacterium]|nr:hypothetical protein [Magnetococcales bacterium]